MSPDRCFMLHHQTASFATREDRQTDRQTSSNVAGSVYGAVQSHLPVQSRCRRWSCAANAMSCRTAETRRRKGRLQHSARPTDRCTTCTQRRPTRTVYTYICSAYSGQAQRLESEVQTVAMWFKRLLKTHFFNLLN